MRKLVKFIIPIAMLLSMTNCANIEYANCSYYTFINNSSSNIELNLCRINDSKTTTYNIKIGGKLTLIYWLEGGFPRRPIVLGKYVDSYIVISNGTTEIIQYRQDKAGLYDLGNYKITRYEPSDKSSSIWYEYEFTDAFFYQTPTE